MYLEGPIDGYAKQYTKATFTESYGKRELVVELTNESARNLELISQKVV